MSGDPNLVAGVCSGLPLGIQDLMWGTDNERVRNKSDRRILKSTARILCDMCPIQAECLAQSIIGREQHSRIGGIDVKARRLLRHRAEADGVDLDGFEGAAARRVDFSYGGARVLEQVDVRIEPGEIVRVDADGYETISPAGTQMKICAFLWVYYG